MPRTPSNSTALPYARDLSGIPRLDAHQEHALACAVVDARRNHWAALLSSPSGLPCALVALARQCEDDGAAELARTLRELVVGRGPHPRRPVAATQAALIERLVFCDPGVACMDAIAGLARLHDAQWHERIQQARAAYLRVRNEFVRANLRLVIAFAKRHTGQHHGLADRIQDGNIGLLRAIERFDPARGVRFSSYACWWIRHSIMRALTNGGRLVRVPSHLCALHSRANRMERRLASELGREPTLLELARAIDTDPQTLTRTMVAMTARTISFDAPVLCGDESVAETIADERIPDAADEIVAAGDHRLAALAFRRLSAKDREILLQRFPPDDAPARTLEEIGRRWGVSRERIRQLQNRALATVRRAVQPDDTPRVARGSSTRVCA